MPKTITITLDDEIYNALRILADEENATLSNFIETAVLRRLEKSENIDNIETAEIRNNRNLNQSLKRGLADAKNKKGSFVRS